MAVKSYNFDTNSRLSDNFCAAEFRCKCGKKHSTLISSELVKALQSLVNEVGAAKAVITSGYRCPAHDRAVGGSGTGQHTLGTAADVVFFGQNGQPMSTKNIACRAQDLGFSGIANIDGSYTAIHLDVRTSGRWYGDEVVGTSSSVTTDFYRYYGISRSNGSVAELQKILNTCGHRLTIDGIAGAKTLSALKTHIVDSGETGELVKWVQKWLNTAGFDCGSADGIAGEKTMSAIHDWQGKMGVGVGYLGGSDWELMVR